HEEEDIGKAVSVRVEDSHRVRRRAAGLELRPRDEARILSVRLEEDEVVRGAFALGDDEQRRALVRAFAAFARLGAEEQGTEVRADLRRKPQGLRKIEAAVLPTRHADRLLLAADDDDLGAGLEIDRRAGETVHARVGREVILARKRAILVLEAHAQARRVEIGRDVVEPSVAVEIADDSGPSIAPERKKARAAERSVGLFLRQAMDRHPAVRGADRDDRWL